MNIIGDVREKRAILVDDIIDTAGTIVGAANALADIGAKEVYACCTHGVLFSGGNGIERIKNSPIKELVMLNTMPLRKEKKDRQDYRSFGCPMFSRRAIERIYGDISISTLFTQQ